MEIVGDQKPHITMPKSPNFSNFRETTNRAAVVLLLKFHGIQYLSVMAPEEAS